MNKKITTKIALFLGIAASALQSQAQVTTETFETFTLSPNSYYQNTTTSGDWHTSEANFGYTWSTTFGGYWESGSAYSNVKDTVDGTYTNIFGNITGSGLSGDNFVISRDGAVVKLNHLSVLSGFYVTNTTYAWKTIKKGDAFSRKFGDTTGTGSGTSIPQGQYPDWFLLKVAGYRNGVAVHDTAKFYLADYRFAGTANDIVINNWQFVNCVNLGIVDSVRFLMSSSDAGQYGMNTPAYFAIDNFITNSTVSVQELANISRISLFPNPAKDNVSINYVAEKESILHVRLYDVTGKEVMQLEQQNTIGSNVIKLETSALEAGVYFVDLSDGVSSKKIKFVKL